MKQDINSAEVRFMRDLEQLTRAMQLYSSDCKDLDKVLESSEAIEQSSFELAQLVNQHIGSNIYSQRLGGLIAHLNDRFKRPLARSLFFVPEYTGYLYQQ